MISIETAKNCVEKLLAYSIDHLSLDKNDVIYVRNQLLDLLKLDSPAPSVKEYGDFQTDIVDPIVEYAIANGIADKDSNILFETRLLGLCTPMPSAVINKFNEIAKRDGVKAATTWMFELSKANNYIRMVDINKNIKWKHVGEFGEIEVTINLSKPEKDPKQIALAKKQKKSGYPACMLCVDNVGFAGHMTHPARQTLRVIPITLNNEDWSLQYSPYQYYDQHIIALCNEHRPMDVNDDCLKRLMDFTELFPNYFLGSNAALPIVGGSILAHDHYQGGSKVLPMFKAPIRNTYACAEDKNVNIYVVDWYNSVVRVESDDKANLLKHACNILNKWKEYSDESCNIICRTDEPHNAVTPIARNENGKFILDMILRNNRTDAEHPYGIFHPTEDMHNIKKEGIGIIEVMGTFILPGRLERELKAVADILSGSVVYDSKSLHDADNVLVKHADMIDSLVAAYGTNNDPEKAKEIITNHVNVTCEKILGCTAVFKNDANGQAGLKRFVESAGYKFIK